MHPHPWPSTTCIRRNVSVPSFKSHVAPPCLSTTPYSPCVLCVSGFLQGVRQLEALALLSSGSPATSSLGRFEEAQAVVQHHDAVAGTAKQHVTYDYAQRVRDAQSSRGPPQNRLHAVPNQQL